MNLKEELLAVERALRSAGVPHALCGGLAVAVHGYPRLTRDIDLLLRPSDLEAARKALSSAGFTIESLIVPFDMGLPHERRVFRLSKAQGEDLLTVGLLLVPPFLEDVWSRRKTYDLEGVPVDVVDRQGLITMKRLAGRPQDLGDIAGLERQ